VQDVVAVLVERLADFDGRMLARSAAVGLRSPPT
jgi:hypothetical protein